MQLKLGNRIEVIATHYAFTKKGMTGVVEDIIGNYVYATWDQLNGKKFEVNIKDVIVLGSKDYTAYRHKNKLIRKVK